MYFSLSRKVKELFTFYIAWWSNLITFWLLKARESRQEFGKLCVHMCVCILIHTHTCIGRGESNGLYSGSKAQRLESVLWGGMGVGGHWWAGEKQAGELGGNYLDWRRMDQKMDLVFFYKNSKQNLSGSQTGRDSSLSYLFPLSSGLI